MSANFQSLWNQAHAAGMAAGQAASPTPMVVGPGSVLVNGVPALSRSYYVSEGVCGFAWVVVHPGNCSFARWAKKTQGARAEYGGGMCVKWVGEFNQSMTRKEAYADAFAMVLREAGIKAYSRSRMD
jgi:hypothetical protein